MLYSFKLSAMLSYVNETGILDVGSKERWEMRTGKPRHPGDI